TDDLSHALLRPVGLDVLGHGVVQLRDSAAAVLAAHPRESDGAVDHLDLREYRHVVRALRDYRRIAGGEFQSVAMGVLSALDHRVGDYHRQFRVVPRVVLAVHPISADRLDDRAQGRRYLAAQGAAEGCRDAMSETVEIIASFPDEHGCAA